MVLVMEFLFLKSYNKRLLAFFGIFLALIFKCELLARTSKDLYFPSSPFINFDNWSTFMIILVHCIFTLDIYFSKSLFPKLYTSFQL